MKSISEVAFGHIVASVISAIIIALVITGVGYLLHLDYLVMPVIVSLTFSMVESIVSLFIWRWVVIYHTDMLTTFYTALSGFRMLLALLVLTVLFLCVSRDEMAPFVVVFMIFYVIMLVIHSRFFSSRARNSLK